MKPTVPNGFTPAPAVPEQVADYLEGLIVRDELAAGERIAEARVTAALGVSRGSVREALQQLAARHLVEVTPRRGARVTDFGPDDVRGLYDLQIALLTLLAQRVARRFDEADLPVLAAHRDRLRAAADAGDTQALLRHARDFELAACDLIGNRYLKETVERLAPAFARAHYRALAAGPGERLGLAQFVEALMSAVVGRDEGAIAEVVLRYGKHQRDLVLATFEGPEAVARAIRQAPP